ncbi:MAG: DUF2281 domain-containing protein [Planctomycetes bacterium]|nr:DUF2281 domain-containing protein [Planctomycetota bacterium]
MSTIEALAERFQRLPQERQKEVLDFIEFLLARESTRSETCEWARFSAQELASAYGPADTVYDQE